MLWLKLLIQLCSWPSLQNKKNHEFETKQDQYQFTSYYLRYLLWVIDGLTGVQGLQVDNLYLWFLVEVTDSEHLRYLNLDLTFDKWLNCMYALKASVDHDSRGSNWWHGFAAIENKRQWLVVWLNDEISNVLCTANTTPKASFLSWL